MGITQHHIGDTKRLLATVMEGTPFPESTAARAVLMNRGLDGCKNVRVCFSTGMRCRRSLRRRSTYEATGQIRHQANAKDQQNEECEDETDAE